jgi:hypothetical protein
MKLSYKSAASMAIAVFGLARGAWAQGCVLCYTSLASSGPKAMHAFEMAMLTLLIPALLLFVGLFLLIFRCTRTNETTRATLRSRVSRWRFFSASPKPVEGRV